MAAAPAQNPTEPATPLQTGLDYEQMLLAAQSYLEASRPNDAANVAIDATHMDPNRPQAYVVWGRAMAQADQLAEAATHYEEARALGSRDPSLFAELASVYDVGKKYPEALAVYRDYLTDHPNDVAMRDELALTLLLVEKPDEAVQELKTALQTQPQSLQLQQDLGYAQLHAGQFAACRDTLERVVQADPHRSDAARFLAQAYIGLNEKKHAKEILTKLVAAYPRDRAANALLQHLQAPPPKAK